MKQLLAIVFLACAGISHSQVLWHDSFESYRPGTNDVYGLYHFDFNQFDLEAGETRPKVITGPKDGVSPYSGSQMFDFRASALGHGRTMDCYVPPSTSDLHPLVTLSIRFAIPTSYSTDMLVKFESSGKNYLGIPVILLGGAFDVTANTFTGLGVSNKPVNMLRSAWNEIKLTLDWNKRRSRTELNGVLVAEKVFSFTQLQKPNLIRDLEITVSPRKLYSDQYAPGDGAPGVLIDDIDIVAVPEVSPLFSVGIGVISVYLRKKRR